jgi:hypothetical protein
MSAPAIAGGERPLAVWLSRYSAELGAGSPEAAWAALKSRPRLDPPSSLYLLHQGMALTSDTFTPLLQAAAPSPIRPHASFADQLTHLALLHLADPRGELGWLRAELSAFVEHLIAMDHHHGVAPLMMALRRERKLMQFSQSYPLRDPLNPLAGVSERTTAAVSALNSVWQTSDQGALKPGPSPRFLLRAGTAPVPTEQYVAASELAAIQTLLTAQNMLGLAAPAFTMASVVSMMAQLDALSAAYPQILNGTFQSWVNQLYTLLAGVTTVYGQNFPALYLTYQVSAFPFNPTSEQLHVNNTTVSADLTVPRWSSNNPPVQSYPEAVYCAGSEYDLQQYGVYPSFSSQNALVYRITIYFQGVELAADLLGVALRVPWTAPANPPSWNQALTALTTSWGPGNTPANVIPRCTFDNYVAAHSAVVDPQSWTDVEQVKAGVVPVWQSQLALMTQCLGAPQLSSDTYLFMLHLSIALTSGNTACQDIAAKLMSAPCASIEYPNDIFANQLVYLALMYMADPAGSYVWSNSQLQQALSDLGNVVTGSDAASQAIQASLKQHLKLLLVDSAYPLQDPYVPAVGFNQRVTDTLYALDQARATVAAGDAQ